MKRILMLGLLALSLLCGTAFAKTGEGMTIWFDTGGSVGDGYGTIVQNGAKAAVADMGCELRLLYSDSVSYTHLAGKIVLFLLGQYPI